MTRRKTRIPRPKKPVYYGVSVFRSDGCSYTLFSPPCFGMGLNEFKEHVYHSIRIVRCRAKLEFFIVGGEKLETVYV